MKKRLISIFAGSDNGSNNSSRMWFGWRIIGSS